MLSWAIAPSINPAACVADRLVIGRRLGPLAERGQHVRLHFDVVDLELLGHLVDGFKGHQAVGGLRGDVAGEFQQDVAAGGSFSLSSAAVEEFLSPSSRFWLGVFAAVHSSP